MKTINLSRWWIRAACGGALLVSLTGCVGVVGPGYYEGPGFVDYGPEVTVFGGWGRGHFDRDAGRRGFESRGGAHGHFGGHR